MVIPTGQGINIIDIIIMDNAPYHIIKINRAPINTHRKQDMIGERKREKKRNKIGLCMSVHLATVWYITTHH